MPTAIFLSQDCLRRNRLDAEAVASSSFRHRRNPNLNPSPDSLSSIRRKRTAVGFQERGRDRKRDRDRTLVVKFPAKNLVMGQVRILKRGEDLKPVTDRGFGDKYDLLLSSTDRLGPEPETVKKQIRAVDGLYAGSSAFLASPPPSSLPFPAFFAKGNKNDVATSDLRRLLRLDLL